MSAREDAEHMHEYAARIARMLREGDVVGLAAEQARHDARGWAAARERSAHVTLGSFGAPSHDDKGPAGLFGERS